MTSVELVRSAVLTDTTPYAYASVTPPGRLVAVGRVPAAPSETAQGEGVRTAPV